jgi:antirestriction protein ArdC
MNPKVKEVLDTILDQFKNSDNIPQSIALLTFPIIILPMNKWSLFNQFFCYLTGLTDFRGYKQWLEAKRYVKKGETATHILVPWIKKDKDEQGEEKPFLAGFITACVFAVEQTEGEPLDYQQLELPDFPLIDRAKDLGVNVAAIPGNYDHYGYFSAKKQVIAVASPEECIFFHELSHCADYRLNGELKGGQDPLQEITAELSALALCNIVGLDGSKHLGNSYHYIEGYAKELNISPYTAILKVICKTEKILNLILKGEENVFAEDKRELNSCNIQES